MAYKKNFNKNYNRNRNNYNSGQYRNNKKNDFYYMNDRPQEQKPTFEGFDARQYIKPDFPVTDMNGKVYMIRGNFSTKFTDEVMKAQKKVNEIQQNEDDFFRYTELLSYLKNWCLLVLNQNVDGETYTHEDVERGFDDITILMGLFIYIGKLINGNVNNENKR